MLVPISLSAEALRRPEEPSAMDSYCNFLFILLQDVIENGIIVVDGERIFAQRIRQLIEDWPQQHRTELKELLARLRQAARIVSVVDPYIPAKTCSWPSCQHSSGIAFSGATRGLVINSECLSCPSIAALNVETVAVTQYPRSRLARTTRERREFELSAAKWTKSEFEQQILMPVFATAKHVQIVDRYIGRSMLGDGGEASLKRRYVDSLEWVLEVFVRQGGSTRGGVFEIYSGFEAGNYQALHIEAIKTEMAGWRDRVSRKYNLNVSVILKKEEPGRLMRHARYLLTDQVRVLLEAGFDLLLSDRQMKHHGYDPTRDEQRIRDVHILLCGRETSLKRELDRLNDL